MSAAARLAELDATDPYPSFNESARRAGVDPPSAAPGDVFLDLEVTLVAYWPEVPAALQEPRRAR